MIWFLIYAALGVATSVYLPIWRASIVREIETMKPTFASVHPDDRARLQSMLEGLHMKISPTAAFMIGLLWPLAAIMLVYGHVQSTRMISRMR